MQEYKLILKGTLPGLNDYLRAERSFTRRNKQGHSCGNDMKQECQLLICNAVHNQMKHTSIQNPVYIHCVYYEPNKRRDPDNISGVAHKFILDSHVKCKVLKNDGWDNIKGFSDRFFIDRRNPRIEVILMEEGG